MPKLNIKLLAATQESGFNKDNKAKKKDLKATLTKKTKKKSKNLHKKDHHERCSSYSTSTKSNSFGDDEWDAALDKIYALVDSIERNIEEIDSDFERMERRFGRPSIVDEEQDH